jgi:hypothetical protein
MASGISRAQHTERNLGGTRKIYRNYMFLNIFILL